MAASSQELKPGATPSVKEGELAPPPAPSVTNESPSAPASPLGGEFEEVSPPASPSLSASAAPVPLEEKKEEDLEPVHVDAESHPIESKMYSSLKVSPALPKSSFHLVHPAYYIVEDKKEEKGEKVEGYLKVFDSKEKFTETPIFQAEAAIANFYKFLTPHYVSNTFAVYNETNNKYVGIFSQALPNFKSLYKDPLKATDLDVSFLAQKKIDIEVIDDLDEELRVLEANQERFDRQLAKLNQEIAELEEKQREQRKNPDFLFVLDDKDPCAQLHQEIEQRHRKKEEVAKQLIQVRSSIKAFYHRLSSDTKERQGIAFAELERYRIVKGLSQSLTAGYIFMEDDLHRNNLSKYGDRIDFDMSFWSILYPYKNEFFKFWRMPGEAATTMIGLGETIKTVFPHKFDISKDDIIQFPKLTKAAPHHWPTRAVPEKSFQSSALSLANVKEFYAQIKNRWAPKSAENAYPEADHSMYQDLATNPVFIHHKFKTLIKHLFTSKDIYREIAKRSIPEDCKYVDGSNMIDVFVNLIAERQEKLKAELLQVPKFTEFFVKHREKMMKELFAELRKAQISFDEAAIRKQWDEFQNSDGFKKANESQFVAEESMSLGAFKMVDDYEQRPVSPVSGKLDAKDVAKLAASPTITRMGPAPITSLLSPKGSPQGSRSGSPVSMLGQVGKFAPSSEKKAEAAAQKLSLAPLVTMCTEARTAVIAILSSGNCKLLVANINNIPLPTDSNKESFELFTNKMLNLIKHALSSTAKPTGFYYLTSFAMSSDHDILTKAKTDLETRCQMMVGKKI